MPQDVVSNRVNHDILPSTFSLHTPTCISILSPFIVSSSSSFLFVSDDESDPEASEFDLGTKIKTPKDVMLEELSLLNNKGSKMFKKRQQRVEKFIVTNENKVRVKKSVCVCAYMLCERVCTDRTITSFVFQQNLQNLLMSPPPVPPKPETPKAESRLTYFLYFLSLVRF